MSFPLFFVVEFSVVLVFESSKETVVLRWWESIAGNLVLTTKLKT